LASDALKGCPGPVLAEVFNGNDPLNQAAKQAKRKITIQRPKYS
jgi:hypothetical protein